MPVLAVGGFLQEKTLLDNFKDRHQKVIFLLQKLKKE